MRELEPAGHPIDLMSPRRGGRPSSHVAIAVSVLAHGLALYALLQQHFMSLPAAPQRVADYFVFELPAPRPAPEPKAEREALAPIEDRAIEAPLETEAEPEPAPIVEPAPPASEPATEPAEPPSERRAAADEPQPAAPEAPPVAPDEAAPVAPPTPRAFIDFDEERRRAAREVITERSAENEYLTFSLDDVVPPRPERPTERKRSIFDGGGGPDFGGRSVGTLGQQRTKLGRKLAELCNAVTGGFAASFMGFGLFSACASPDTGPTGLFPEVRPAYLDLLPECVDTRDTAPALALEAPFPTVKCRLVKRDELQGEP
jgi:hypothetical protein